MVNRIHQASNNAKYVFKLPFQNYGNQFWGWKDRHSILDTTCDIESWHKQERFCLDNVTNNV